MHGCSLPSIFEDLFVVCFGPSLDRGQWTVDNGLVCNVAGACRLGSSRFAVLSESRLLLLRARVREFVLV